MDAVIVNGDRGTAMDDAALTGRLRKIEGQVRGLQRMVERREPCVEILDQIASVQGALRAVGLGLLEGHVRHCLDDARTAVEPTATSASIDDALRAVERLART